MKRFFLLSLLAFLVLSVPIAAQTVTLQWDPNTETDLTGYKVYWGIVSSIYTSSVTVGLVTTYTVTNLGGGTYYFAVTALNTAGLESGYSNEVSTVIPIPPVAPPSSPLKLRIVTTVATTATTASIAWKTSVPTDGSINYGLTLDMGTVKVIDVGLVTDHLAKLTGLTSGKTYYYRVTSKDASGGIVTGNGTFVTK